MEFFYYFVKMIREGVTTGVDVDGGAESTDVDSLSDASPDPVLLVVYDRDVLLAKMMALLLGMLQQGRLIFAKGIGRG